MGKKVMRLGMQEEHAPLDGDTRGGNLAESRDARTFDVGCRCCVDRETRAKPWRSAPILLTNADAETKLC